MSNHISRLRHRKGITQAQLAQAARISRVHVTDIEAGNKRPSLETFVKLMDALDVSSPSDFEDAARELAAPSSEQADVTDAEAGP